MAVRRPMFLFTDNTQIPPETSMFEYTDAYMEDIIPYASFVHSQYPSTELVTSGTTGTVLPNQNFTDTYYVAGAYTTRVDRFATAAETPNVQLVTDTYSRIRVIDRSGTEPTSDVNNFEYPLYLTADNNLRAMTRQDFIDTFVLPALPIIAKGGTNSNQGGTYFLTTSPTPANATVASTPVAVNSVSNLSAYTSGGIPESVKQVSTTTYYLAKVNYDDDVTYGNVAISLPMYWDPGTETIKTHTEASWAALLGPFLRYYIGTNPQYKISYNINGAGEARGSLYTDSRRTPSGTGYTTRFVNVNDYRTQEFPTGTESTIAGSNKRLYMQVGTPGATYSASSNPIGSVNEGSSVTFTMTTTNVSNGSELPYAITGITEADISSGSLSGNIIINSNTGSTTITLVADGITEGETITFTCGGDSVNVTVNDRGVSAFPNSTLAGWGTESREIYNQFQGALAQAFCDIDFVNEFNANSRVKIETVSGTNAAVVTPKVGYIQIGPEYTSPTVEFRYVWTNPGGAGLNFDDTAYASGTWYTLTNGGGSATLNAIAEATAPANGQDSQATTASTVYFEVRISQAGQPTVVRTSATDAINLFALASTNLAP